MTKKILFVINSLKLSQFWIDRESQFRATRSKTILIEIKRSIFGNMELGPVDFIFAAVFIYNTVSFISKLVRNGFR